MRILTLLLLTISIANASSLTYNYNKYKQVRYKLSGQGILSNIFSKDPPVVRFDTEADILLTVLPMKGDSLDIKIEVFPKSVAINGIVWPLSSKYNMLAMLTMLPNGKGLRLRQFKGYRMSSNVFMGVYHGLLPQFPDNIRIGTTWQQGHKTEFRVPPDYKPSLDVSSTFLYDKDEKVEGVDLIHIVVRSTQVILEKRVKGKGRADMLLKFSPTQGIVSSGTLRWQMSTDFTKNNQKERVFWDQQFSLQFIEAK